MLNKICCC